MADLNPHRAIVCAEALKVHLDTGSFIIPVAIERVYVPKVRLESFSAGTFTILVAARSLVETVAARKMWDNEIQVDIGLLYKLAAGDEVDFIDKLGQVVREMIEHVRFSSLSTNRFLWLRTENEPIYAPEDMERFRQFTSILTVTYKEIAAL